MQAKTKSFNQITFPILMSVFLLLFGIASARADWEGFGGWTPKTLDIALYPGGSPNFKRCLGPVIADVYSGQNNEYAGKKEIIITDMHMGFMGNMEEAAINFL